jgi:hypothetical protein
MAMGIDSLNGSTPRRDSVQHAVEAMKKVPGFSLLKSKLKFGMASCRVCNAILTVVLFLLVGFLVYSKGFQTGDVVLVPSANGTAPEFTTPWGFVDTCYFTMVTVTTVGYGDLSPETDGGKIFTIFYAFLGIGMIGSALGLIAEWILDQQEAMAKKAAARILAETEKAIRKVPLSMDRAPPTSSANVVHPADTAVITVDGDLRGKGEGGDGENMRVPHIPPFLRRLRQALPAIDPAVWKKGTKYIQMFVPVLVFMCLGMIMGEIEGWNGLDSIYFSIITICTIGSAPPPPKHTPIVQMVMSDIFLNHHHRRPRLRGAASSSSVHLRSLTLSLFFALRLLPRPRPRPRPALSN